MKFRSKIFWFSSALIVTTILVSFYILNWRFSDKIYEEINQNLYESESLFNQLLSDRTELLTLLSKNIAGLPQLKALAAIQDSLTINAELVNWSESNRKVDLFVVAGPSNNVITFLTRDKNDVSGDFHSSIESNIRNMNSLTGFWILGDCLFQISSEPIIVNSNYIGSLILGDLINDGFAGELKILSNSDISFLVNNKIYASSYEGGSARPDLINEISTETSESEELNITSGRPLLVEFVVNGEEQIGRAGSLTGDVTLLYVLTRSLAVETEVLTQLRNVLLMLGGGSMILVFLISLIISQRITSPLNSLVLGTKAIASGDYDTKLIDTAINENSKDEISLLSGSFETMRNTIRENIGKITSLNKELIEKNTRLETALDELKIAQDELIKTEKLSTVGRMASSIIHDFKSPMQVIMGMSGILKMPNVDENKKKDMIGYIEDAVKRMNAMTMDILDFAKGETNLDKERKTLSEIINSLLMYLSNDLMENKFQVVRDAVYDPELEIDVIKIKRAFENIIRNTIEAGTEDNNILEIKTKKENGKVLISISDNGPGIPEDILDTLFEPFVTKGKSGGTGLGLSITKKLIEDHDGNIEVTSVKGKGTTFKLMLPTVS